MTITAYSVPPVAYFIALGVFILFVVLFLGVLWEDVRWYRRRDKITVSAVVTRIASAAGIASIIFMLGVNFSESSHKERELVKFAQTYGIVLPSYSTQIIKIPNYHDPASEVITAHTPGEEDPVNCLVVADSDYTLRVMCEGTLLHPVR